MWEEKYTYVGRKLNEMCSDEFDKKCYNDYYVIIIH